MAFSVGIVGAGPAGAFCAWRLAAAGIDVTVYDPSHPREKPCGGGVTARVFERWPELERIRPLGRPSTVVRIRGPHTPEITFPMQAPIEIFPRAVLDGRILEEAIAAGAVHRSERVRHIARTANRRISLEVGARTVEHDFLVGADGAASVVRRALLDGAPGSATSYATAGFHVSGLPEVEIVIAPLRGEAGYVWVFPRPDHSSVGIAVRVGRGSGRELRDRVLRFLARRYPGSLDLPREAYGAAIPIGGGAVSGPRFALIGDAANANDAITGEGIHHAIDGAGILADTLAELGPAEAPAAFARRWSDGPGGDLAACRGISRTLYRPVTVDLALLVARRSERLRRVMASTATEARPYRGLPGRLVTEVLLGRG